MKGGDARMVDFLDKKRARKRRGGLIGCRDEMCG